MRQQQSQHNGEKDNFCAEQKAVKKIDQRGSDTHYRPADPGKNQDACRRRQSPVQPLVEAGGQQLAGAANIGGGESVQQKQHAKPGSPLPVAAKIARGQRPQSHISQHVLIHFQQQQSGITHQRPQRYQQTKRYAETHARRGQRHR